MSRVCRGLCLEGVVSRVCRGDSQRAGSVKVSRVCVEVCRGCVEGCVKGGVEGGCAGTHTGTHTGNPLITCTLLCGGGAQINSLQALGGGVCWAGYFPHQCQFWAVLGLT